MDKKEKLNKIVEQLKPIINSENNHSNIRIFQSEINKAKESGNDFRKYGLLNNSWYIKFKQFLIDGITEKK